MLKQIVFLIVDETQIESARKLKENIDAEENWIHICGKERLRDYDKETTLFVTDASLIMQELKRQGRYAIAFLHANNGAEDWSGASYMITDIEELEADSFVKAYQRMAGEAWTILETNRCIIRETIVEDVDEFYRIYAEPSITYYMDALYPEPEKERAYAKEYIEKIYGFYGYGMWSVVNKETGKVMGRAGLSWREGYDIPELGFMIEVAYQRQGFAEEVCRAILEYGREELGFDAIQTLVKEENTASVNLCKKLGFKWNRKVEERGEEYEYYVLQREVVRECRDSDDSHGG